MNDIYAAPSAELTESVDTGDYGSVDKGINGDYDFAIGEVLSEAWQLTNGIKWTTQLALGLYFIVYLALMAITTAITMSLSVDENVSAVILQLVLTVLGAPMGVGLMMLGLRRSVNAPFEAMAIMQPYNKLLLIVATLVIMYIMIAIGLVLLILPGIYLALAYYFATMLVIDKGMGPWQALETSRKAVGKRWFAFLGLGIAISFINLLAIIPLGLGLIWTIPMSITAYGIVYRNMFGCEPETAAG